MNRFVDLCHTVEIKAKLKVTGFQFASRSSGKLHELPVRIL